jgi:hypothetical protein
MPTPDELLTETFRRFMTNWSVITSLRQVAEVGLLYVEKALAEEHATGFLLTALSEPHAETGLSR